jgi:vacuolar-type H+-ATPase subunit E/Vma4
VNAPVAHHPLDTGLAQDLEPVRRALLAEADLTAQQILDEASHAAECVTRNAERESAAQLDEVNRRNQRSAQAYRAQALRRAHSEAHEVRLRTQAAIHQQLVDHTRRSVVAMRSDPRYPALLDGLEALARRQLGAGAVIDRDPDPDGGLIAVSGSRRVDYTLPALADRALDALGDEVALLWA